MLSANIFHLTFLPIRWHRHFILKQNSMNKYLVAVSVGVFSLIYYYFIGSDDSYENATLQYLSNVQLQKLGGSNELFEASELWQDRGAVIMVVRRPGCLLCREEAAELTKLKEQFDQHGFSLFAVVHEVLGVEEFRNFFDGQIFLDKERKFYGPKERWMFLSGVLRPSVWLSIFRARGKQISGNLEGEGRLLGGLFVIGPGNEGILLEHRESEFGDHVKHDLILQVMNKN